MREVDRSAGDQSVLVDEHSGLPNGAEHGVDSRARAAEFDPAVFQSMLDRSFLAIIEEVIWQDDADRAEWQIAGGARHAGMWIRAQHTQAATPEQGWKLHLSAALPFAEAVLRRALPVLKKEIITFKVATSLRALASLNQAEGGFSQIGKFITIYPTDDAQAVRLALALDEATRGFRGPAIPSDRALAPRSLVHYRYGGFWSRQLQLPIGEIVSAITAPDGELVPDRRLGIYQPPEWAVDPFAQAGIVTDSAPPRLFVARRYLLVSLLHKSASNDVQLGVDIENERRCVIKRAARDGTIGLDGEDASSRLRREASVLARLSPDPRFPALYDLIEEDDELSLVMEDMAGEMLSHGVGELLALGRFARLEQVIAWGSELAAALDTVHAEGLVYRDLKPTNVMLGPDGHLRLIDFGLACEPGAGGTAFGRGTQGYMSPQQAAGAAAAVLDDVYSLGALLYYLATSAEPSYAPGMSDLLKRPISLLNPVAHPDLAEVIARCLEPEAARRIPSMAAVQAALAAIDVAAPIEPVPFGGEPAVEEVEARLHAAGLARRLGETLCRAAQRQPEAPGVVWLTTSRRRSGAAARDLGTGSAGAVLALAECVAVFDLPEHRATLEEGARWLMAGPRPAGQPLPGLYVGEAGVGAALLRAGQVLDNGALIEMAAARGHFIATLPNASPDLYNGTAGRLRFHLLLWDATGDPRHLQHAIADGKWLLDVAEGVDEPCWCVPAGYTGLSGQAYLGYAHGAAGIADALLDLFEATGDKQFLTAARGVGGRLARAAMPALDDGSGVTWPPTEDGQPRGATWCHGSAGIGRFFLHAAMLDALPEAHAIAARAARLVARGARWTNPVQCHGLSGNIEFLLDMFQATGDGAYLVEARSQARALEAFAVEEDGMVAWPAEWPKTFSPDYLVGYAGVLVCLLRLADPDHQPHQLSRSGFQHRPRAMRGMTLSTVRGVEESSQLWAS